MKKLIVIAMSASMVMGQVTMENYLEQKYDDYGMNRLFKVYASQTLEKHKEREGYFSKVFSKTTAIGTEDLVNNMCNETFDRYTQELSAMIASATEDEALREIIRSNYEEDIQVAYKEVYNQVGSAYAFPFERHYTGLSQLAKLDESILEKIQEIKTNEFGMLQQSVLDQQETTTEKVIAGAVTGVVGVAMKKVMTNIALSVTSKLGSRVLTAIPVVGPVIGVGMAAYEASTPNALLEMIEEELVSGFEDSERKIVAAVVDKFKRFDYVNAALHEELHELTQAYITNIETIDAYLGQNEMLKRAVLSQDTEAFMEYLGVFTQVPGRHAVYLTSKYIDFNNADRVRLLSYITKSEDFSGYEAMKTYEENIGVVANARTFYEYATFLSNYAYRITEIVNYLQRYEITPTTLGALKKHTRIALMIEDTPQLKSMLSGASSSDQAVLLEKASHMNAQDLIALYQELLAQREVQPTKKYYNYTSTPSHKTYNSSSTKQADVSDPIISADMRETIKLVLIALLLVIGIIIVQKLTVERKAHV